MKRIKLLSRFYQRVVLRRPFSSFLLALAILFGVIILGNTIFKQKPVPTPQKNEIKTVDTYTIGKIPTIRVQAQIQKNGEITINAQSPGIVSAVNITEGDQVSKGQNLVSLSSNYQGGNSPSLQRQLAQAQYNNVVDTFNTQKDIIQKQRDLANKNADNTEQLRSISAQSTPDTQSLLDLNNNILSTIATNQTNLEQNNTNGASDALILQTKQLRATFQASVNGLQAQLRNLNYITNPSNPPTEIANTTKDLTLKQLDLQEKALNLTKEASQIQLNLAFVNEALMFPTSPVSGTVQKVFIHEGESVAPGAPLVTIYSPSGNVSATAKVPQSVAGRISQIEASTLLIGDKTISAFPRFISTQATDGQLYSVIFDIPEEYQDQVVKDGFISLDLPVGHLNAPSTDPFVPIDAVFQTQDRAFIYLATQESSQSGKLVAVSKTVELGDVLGSDVEVKSGLSDGDQIILTRNVVSGDKVISN